MEMQSRKVKEEKYECKCRYTPEELEWKTVSFTGLHAPGDIWRKSIQSNAEWGNVLSEP